MQWILTGMVAAGALILLVSVHNSRHLSRIVPTTLKSKWRILTLLIGLFILGYCGYLLIQFAQINFPLQLLISTIFFCGSLFVYGIVSLTDNTLHQLKLLNDNLELEVAKRTDELNQSNRSLNRTQHELLHQNDFLHSVINALPHPFLVLDPETYEIILANTVAGFSPLGEGRFCHMLSHGQPLPCRGDRHPCPIIEIKKTGSPTVVQHVHYNRQNEERIVEVHGYPIHDQSGKLIQVIEYSIDITEKKQIENDLIEAKLTAEDASAAKGAFLANMSHEIRTPMNAIMGMSYLALQTELDSKQRDYITKVHHSATHLLRILNDILDISKLEAGKMQIVTAPFLLRDCIEEVVKTLQVQAQQKGVQLLQITEDDLPQFLVGDDLRLRQVLVNLVGNAIKFTQTGSVRIEVSADGGAPPADDDSLHLHFQIRDTGIGIAPEMVERIFECFEQGDASCTRKFGGTGLGLSICKQIVTLMGGKIWAESQLEKGSCFHFTLNLQRANGVMETGMAPSSQAMEQQLSDLRILLVDDNEVNREVAMMMLEHVHPVTTANNGLEALKKLAEDDFDMVLMDVQMPEMDGLTATAAIRALEKGEALRVAIPEEVLLRLRQRLNGRRIPIIAMTAHALEKDQQRCLDAGMNGYISKPFQYAQMLETFQSIRQNALRFA
ncbi:MAG: ATP-binding protein [Desulfobulbus sp.]|nr:ATP-binding protein [Desulfobulbus sp.]